MRHQKARQNEIKRWTCASPQKKKIEHMKAHIYKKKEEKNASHVSIHRESIK
jgi:hypothetical protein